jgi:hypothetical protein
MLPVLIGAYLGWRVGGLFEHPVGYMFGVILGASFGGFAALVAGERYKTIASVMPKLASLRGSDSLSGSFFLGCGSIGTTPHYVYYQCTKDGGYEYARKRADTGDAFVYEEDRTDGILEVVTYRPPAWMRGWLVFWEVNHVWNFHIPKGSIQRSFSL